MKKYIIFWGTDYCDIFTERSGETCIEAESEEEAIKKFYDLKIPKANIFEVVEERK